MKKSCWVLLFFISAITLLKGQSLKGSAWVLKSIDNIGTGRSQVIDANAKISLLFNSDTTYSGYGCNPYIGKYISLNGKTLTMQKADALPNPNCLGLGTLEKDLLALYLKATRYRIDKEKLFIFTSDEHRIIFVKQ